MHSNNSILSHQNDRGGLIRGVQEIPWRLHPGCHRKCHQATQTTL